MDAGSKQRDQRQNLRIKQTDFSQGRRERQPVQTHEDAARGSETGRQRACGRSVGARMSGGQINSGRGSRASARNQGHELEAVVRAARRRAPCKVLGVRRRRGVPRLLLPWREAASRMARMPNQPSRMSHALMPNPSLKRSANGRPPGPVWRYAVHFRQPGPGILPLSPA